MARQKKVYVALTQRQWELICEAAHERDPRNHHHRTNQAIDDGLAEIHAVLDSRVQNDPWFQGFAEGVRQLVGVAHPDPWTVRGVLDNAGLGSRPQLRAAGVEEADVDELIPLATNLFK